MRETVYAIATDDGFMKIGVSVDPVRRMGAIQTGNHRKLSLLHSEPITAEEVDPYALERELHKQMAPLWTIGEWFKATMDDFYAALDVVQNSPHIFRAEVVCKFCGGDHSWLYCRTKPDGWKPAKSSTAARMDVRKHGNAASGHPSASTAQGSQAGTQAPPVETKPKRGRPHGPLDRKTYRAEWMREWRRKRAELKARGEAE